MRGCNIVEYRIKVCFKAKAGRERVNVIELLGYQSLASRKCPQRNLYSLSRHILDVPAEVPISPLSSRSR